jgi:hypothetical protein
VKPLTILCILHTKIARYDSLLNAKLPTTDNKHSIWFEKNINNYDLDAVESLSECSVEPALAGKAALLAIEMR